MQSLDDVSIEAQRIASVKRVFGSRSSVIFEDEEGQPLITRYTAKGSLAYFCGLGASRETAHVIGQLVKSALRTIKAPTPSVTQADDDILWNVTADGYVILVNCSDEPASARVCKEPCAYWDVLEQRLVKDPAIELNMEPNSFRVLRWTPKTAKLYDVVGAVQLKSMSAGAGRADVVVVSDNETEYLVRTAPREVFVDGRPVNVAVDNCGDFDRIRTEGVRHGEHLVTLKW